MTVAEIVYVILFGGFVIYTIVSKLIDRKSHAKLILDLFKLMFDIKLCKIEPEEAQELYYELYEDAFTGKRTTKKAIKRRVDAFIKEVNNKKVK